MGVHFQVVTYKELATFPSEWEVWKRFLQSVVSSQVWKSVFQVFKVKVLSSKCVKESFSSCWRFQRWSLRNVWKRVLQVVESFNDEVWSVCKRGFLSFWKLQVSSVSKTILCQCYKFQVKFQILCNKVFKCTKVFLWRFCFVTYINWVGEISSEVFKH